MCDVVWFVCLFCVCIGVFVFAFNVLAWLLCVCCVCDVLCDEVGSVFCVFVCVCVFFDVSMWFDCDLLYCGVLRLFVCAVSVCMCVCVCV